MKPTRELRPSRRDFIKLMSSLGLVTLSPSGCALLVSSAPTHRPAAGMIALRNPAQTGHLSESELHQIWQIFDYIGRFWESRELCAIQEPHQFEPIITLKTSQAPSYLREYREALAHFRRLSQDLDPQQVLHQLYFGNLDEHLKRFVIIEFLRLHVALGGFRFLPYQNTMGYAGGPFSDDEHLPYRSLGDSC